MSKLNSTKPKASKYNPLFPPHLRNKKIDPNTCEYCKSNLEKYLKTEDPEYLFKALKTDFRILIDEGNVALLESLGIDYNEEFGDLHKEYEFVNHHTIVWSAIRYWRFIYSFEYESKKRWKSLLGADAERLLKRIGASLVPNVQGAYICQDGLMHQVPDMKLTYQLPKSFIDRYERIREFFRSQNRNKEFLRQELEKEKNKNELVKFLKVMKEIKEEDIDGFVSENYFHIYKQKSDPTDKTKELISFIHSYLCKYQKCIDNNPSQKTLSKLFTQAKRDIVNID